MKVESKIKELELLKENCIKELELLKENCNERIKLLDALIYVKDEFDIVKIKELENESIKSIDIMIRDLHNGNK